MDLFGFRKPNTLSVICVVILCHDKSANLVFWLAVHVLPGTR